MGGRGPRWQLGLGRENGLMFWAMMVLEASFASFFSFLPLYIAYLGADGTRVGLIMSAWGGLRIVFLSLSGFLLDRFAPVPLVLVARGVGIVGLLLAAAMPVWWLLPIALAFTGVGNIAFPAISSLIAGAADERGRARAFALIYTVAPAIATVIVPLFAGAAAEALNLRVTPLLGATFAGLSLLFFARLRPQARPAHEDQTPSTYREAMAFAPIRNICLLLVATLVVLTVGTTLAPNFLYTVHGIEYDRIGQLSSIAAVGSIILSLVFTRFKPLGRPLMGVTIATASTGVMFALLVLGQTWPIFALGYLLRGGYMVAWALFSAALGDVTPPRLRGRTFALGEIAAGISLTVAPLVAGPLFNWHPAAPLTVALIASFPMVALLALAARRERRGVASADEVALSEGVA